MSETITARDVAGQNFRKRLRGFDPEDVQLYLRSVADRIESLTLECDRLRDETSRLRTERDQHRERERTLQQTLVSAQKMADELRRQSETDAELLVKEARLKADRLLEKARDQLARIDEEKADARMERDAFERRLESVIEQHQKLIELRRQDRDEPDNVTMFRSSRTEAG